MKKTEKTMDMIHKGLLKKFHTLCGVIGMSPDEKKAIVESYGVESSRDIDTHDLIDICASLAKQAAKLKGYQDMDTLRKRAMASIGGYLKKVGQESNAGIIKGIACRATGYRAFNDIPAQRLLNVYHTFLNKQKDTDTVGGIATEYLLQIMASRSTSKLMS